MKPVASMTRKELEQEATAIPGRRLLAPPSELHMGGLRAAVRLARRRAGGDDG